MKWKLLALLACAAVSNATQASAQQSQNGLTARSRFAAGLSFGIVQFDLSGTGSTAIFGARLDRDLQRWLVAEAAVGFFEPYEQFGGRSRYTIPEAQLQAQLPLGSVRPYLGIGGGAVFGSGRGSTVTVSGATGVRVAIPATHVDGRAELRVRGIGPSFGASTAEWILGAAYRF
jgi:hypothetical protein